MKQRRRTFQLTHYSHGDCVPNETNLNFQRIRNLIHGNEILDSSPFTPVILFKSNNSNELLSNKLNKKHRRQLSKVYVTSRITLCISDLSIQSTIALLFQPASLSDSADSTQFAVSLKFHNKCLDFKSNNSAMIAPLS